MGNLNGKYQVKVLGIEDYQALTACQSACPLGTDADMLCSSLHRPLTGHATADHPLDQQDHTGDQPPTM